MYRSFNTSNDSLNIKNKIKHLNLQDFYLISNEVVTEFCKIVANLDLTSIRNKDI